MSGHISNWTSGKRNAGGNENSTRPIRFRSDEHERLAVELWRGMRDLFGTVWTQRRGVEPSRGWIAGLNRLEPDEIRRGMVAMLDEWTGSDPPTWPEFRALCRPGTPEQRAFNARIVDTRPGPAIAGEAHAALPTIEETFDTSATGRAWAAFMRGTYAGDDEAAMREEHDARKREALKRFGVEPEPRCRDSGSSSGAGSRPTNARKAGE